MQTTFFGLLESRDIWQEIKTGYRIWPNLVNVLKFRTFFLFLHSNFRAGIQKMLVRIANKEDPDQTYYGPYRKTCLRWFVNSKGADQPAHPCSLISAFVIHLLESNISKLALSEILLFYLVSVAEQAGFGMT